MVRVTDVRRSASGRIAVDLQVGTGTATHKFTEREAAILVSALQQEINDGAEALEEVIE